MKKWILVSLVLALPFLFQSVDSTPRENVRHLPYYEPINGGELAMGFRFSASSEETPPFGSDRVLLKFRTFVPSGLRTVFLDIYQPREIKNFSPLGVYSLKIPASTSVEEMVFVLGLNPFIEYAEPDYTARIAVTPNDPDFRLQYALNNTGQLIGNVPGSPQGKDSADIKATLGWEETTGREDVTIGIVDTGLDFDHPELMNKYVSRGRDFVNDDWDATDDNGHGTHVASIIAADTDNGVGMAGVAWKCKVLPAKAIAQNGVGFYSWIIDAVIWLADNGANVINFSIGGDASSQALEDAVQYAHEKGVVLAAAAGNDTASVLYPAAYDSYCLAVAATDYNDTRPSWSNTGPEVDVAAPGVRILGCVPTWYWEVLFGDIDSEPYGYGYGTSVSVPHVSGLAALIRSIKPDLTVNDIMNIIRYSADDVNQNQYSGKDIYLGHGRINMEKALRPILIIEERK